MGLSLYMYDSGRGLLCVQNSQIQCEQCYTETSADWLKNYQYPNCSVCLSAVEAGEQGMCWGGCVTVHV